jgi:D-glycero-D-manno-heptose 1,7-bisphosphate phosphatase
MIQKNGSMPDRFKFSAVFLDRDGVINRRISDSYVTASHEFEFLPGATEAIRILSGLFQFLFIVTNQQGIGRKLMTEEQLNVVHLHMLDMIRSSGGRIDKIYFCPHLANDSCSCRKPGTGMFQNARKDFPDINTSASVMVGDTVSDMLFGKASGLKTILITDEISHKSEILKLADEQYQSLLEMAKHFQKINVT